jgi:hypothetical protein
MRHAHRVKERERRKAPTSVSWGVTVRLSNGVQLVFAGDSGRQGQAEWSPRAADAYGFDTADEARAFADGCETNSAALGYAVIELRA